MWLDFFCVVGNIDFWEIIHKKVEISAKGDFWISIDGELVNMNQVTIEVIPGAFQFAVPEM